MIFERSFVKAAVIGVVLALVPALAAFAQSGDKPPLKPEEIEQLVAPIALYPDSLVSQIMMASTYPLEVVEAQRWAKANPDLTKDAAQVDLENQPWDPSVKSLVNFPQVLDMMNEKLSWTKSLGDAFIEQQKDVMDAVQRLRAKAQAQGNLQTNEQQIVKVEPAPAATVVVQGAPAPPAQVIVIQPANPQVIYVPTYNPVVVYGAWPYPAYPPYYYYPPHYVSSSVVGFGVGFAAGAAWGYAWGNCDWGRGDVNINNSQNININNNNINRNKYQNQINNRPGGGNSWQHNSAHRQGVAYRDQRTAQKFGGASTREAEQARSEFRGRADAGRQDINRGGADQFKGATGDRAAQQNRAAASDRAGNTAQANRASTGDRAGNAAQQNRASSSGGSGAFGGVDRGGSAARSESQRGSASRSGGGGSRSSGGGGGSKGGSGGRR